jgi:hypothetical protein
MREFWIDINSWNLFPSIVLDGGFGTNLILRDFGGFFKLGDEKACLGLFMLNLEDCNKFVYITPNKNILTNEPILTLVQAQFGTKFSLSPYLSKFVFLYPK